MEGTSPFPSSGDASEAFDPEESPCPHAQILAFPNHISFCPWTVYSLTLSGVTFCHTWPRGSPSSSSN